jgi:hypothetical protein
LGSNLSAGDQERILNDLESVLEISTPRGSNKVIIAHGFLQGVSLGQLSDMKIMVVKPLGERKGYEIVPQVTLAELRICFNSFKRNRAM